MPRWEADGKSRLEESALDLFLEVGYDATTVAAISRRAGLQERSFYRYFADKREVLFSSADLLIDHLTGRAAAASPGPAPLRVLMEAFASAEDVFLPKEVVRRRTRAIAGSAALGERELIKFARLSEALQEVLRHRGVEPAEARLAVDAGLSVFLLASQRWLESDSAFAELLEEALQQQRGIVTADAG